MKKKPAKRRENVTGRKDSEFEPWLDIETASMAAQTIIKQGCFYCGAITSPVVLEGPDGKRFTGQQWHPMQNLESGEERVTCTSCHELIPH